MVSILAGVLVAVLVWGLFIGLLLLSRARSPREPAAAREQPASAPSGVRALNEADAAWRRFTEATDFGERIGIVLDSARVAPMMRDFHERRGHHWPSMNTRSQAREIRRDGRTVVVFEVEDFAGRRYPVAMEWDGKGFAVDWESLTAYGTMDWIELLETRPTAPQIVRVYLRSLPSELQPPASLAAGRSFALVEHRDFRQSAMIALPPDVSPDILALVEGRRVPVTIELLWNPDLRSFEWLRLIARSWNAPR